MITIECRSGFIFQCHPIGGQVFASVDEANVATGEQAIRRTFNACHAHTDESGPYGEWAPPGSSKPAWERLHFSDLLHAMFTLRMGSFTQKRSETGYVNALDSTPDERPVGQILDFEVPCKACGKLFGSSVDLLDLISTGTDWTDETRLAISRGEDYKTKTRGGDTIFWRPSTLALNGPFEKEMKRIVGPAYGTKRHPEGVLEQIAKHVTRVITKRPKKNGSGLEEYIINPGDVRGVYNWLKRAGNGEDLDQMLMELDTRQPTVSNECLLDCYHCGIQQRQALPFGGTYFFPNTSPQAKEAREKLRRKLQEEEKRKRQEVESAPATSSPSSSPT